MSANDRVRAQGETYESLNIEPKPLRPHILAAATVVFGEDFYNGQRETISLSGFVQLNKWPMPGFSHRVDERGYAEFDLELISAPEVGIKGYSYFLDDRIQVLSNPLLPNSGHVRQIVPGQNFPAHFHIRRFGVLGTSTLRLAHRNVINIDGVVDDIPPFKKPLTAPCLGTPPGDGPCTVVQAPNVVRGTNLPEAWYPANKQNQPTGIVPTMFFAPSSGPCMSMLVDPSMIMQSTMEGEITLQINGQSHVVELAGSHKLAAGSEILLFDGEKHGEGEGVLAQLARVAMVGNCAALDGRIMLRASFFKVSSGRLGVGWEPNLGSLSFPAELQFDAQLEIVTPHGVLYATNPVQLYTTLTDLQLTGAELKLEGPGAPLATQHGDTKARLTDVRLLFGDALVSEEAFALIEPAS